MRAFGLFMLLAVMWLALVPQLLARLSPRDEPHKSSMIVLVPVPGNQHAGPAISQMPLIEGGWHSPDSVVSRRRL